MGKHHRKIISVRTWAAAELIRCHREGGSAFLAVRVCSMVQKAPYPLRNGWGVKKMVLSGGQTRGSNSRCGTPESIGQIEIEERVLAAERPEKHRTGYRWFRQPFCASDSRGSRRIWTSSNGPISRIGGVALRPTTGRSFGETRHSALDPGEHHGLFEKIDAVLVGLDRFAQLRARSQVLAHQITVQQTDG